MMLGAIYMDATHLLHIFFAVDGLYSIAFVAYSESEFKFSITHFVKYAE